jgi:hypothetical protein
VGKAALVPKLQSESERAGLSRPWLAALKRSGNHGMAFYDDVEVKELVNRYEPLSVHGDNYKINRTIRAIFRYL